MKTTERDRIILSLAAGLAGGFGMLAAKLTFERTVRALEAQASADLAHVHSLVGSTINRGRSLIISCMGLATVKWWPNAVKPTLLEWPGEGPGHPSWANVAASLRDGEGRLLPRLLAKYSLSNAERIAVVGFSAGSNSGIRELIRHPEDRARIAFVGAFDGLYPALSDQSVWNTTNPRSYFVDPKQIDPWLGYMRLAATGQRIMVMTASSIAAPGPGIAPTKLALTKLLEQAGIDMGRLKAGSLPWDLVPTDGDRPLPGPTQQFIEETVKAGVEYSTMGRLNALLARPGASPQQDHLAQAAIVPEVLKATLVPLWVKVGS
jgi:hypothetical protein